MSDLCSEKDHKLGVEYQLFLHKSPQVQSLPSAAKVSEVAGDVKDLGETWTEQWSKSVRSSQGLSYLPPVLLTLHPTFEISLAQMEHRVKRLTAGAP